MSVFPADNQGSTDEEHFAEQIDESVEQPVARAHQENGRRSSDPLVVCGSKRNGRYTSFSPCFSRVSEESKDATSGTDRLDAIRF
jgi:hypothetical protein